MPKDVAEKINYPPPGRYIIAVSGGVDSMSLLDVLAKEDDYELIVAHFDHGIRPDSGEDAEFVEQVAEEYGLESVSQRRELGPDASEAEARHARYEFLNQVREEYEAEALITAHHLDDRIETMLLNQQRGVSWRGLAPLRETERIRRPLLNIWKDDLRAHAEKHNLSWREDRTNQIIDTPRNYIRQELARHPERKRQLQKELAHNDRYRDQREGEVEAVVGHITMGREAGRVVLDRSRFIQLDVPTARDVLSWILSSDFGMSLSKQQAMRLEHFAKTAHVDKRHPLRTDVQARVRPNQIIIELLETA